MAWPHQKLFGSGIGNTHRGASPAAMSSSSSCAPATKPTTASATLPAGRQEDVQTAKPGTAEPTAAVASAGVNKESLGRTLLPEIQRLKAEQAALRAKKQQVAKELKNAERKRSRLKKRAKLLSDSDLVAVMMLRVAEKKDTTLAAAGEAKDASEKEGKDEDKQEHTIPEADMDGPDTSAAEKIADE